MVDKLGRPFARPLAHSFENARLGHAAQIVRDRRPPAHGHHVEPGCSRQPVGLRQPHLKAVLADSHAAIGVRLLVERVDAEAHAMGEKLHAGVVVEIGQPVPERRVIRGDMIAPAFVPFGHRPRRGAVAQILGLRREMHLADLGLDATPRGMREETVRDQPVQKRGHGDMGARCHGIAQGERTMRSQFADQAVGKRPDRLDLILLLVCLGGGSANRNHGALHARRLIALGRRARIVSAIAALGLDRRLVPGPDIATLDQQRSIGIDADEGPGPGHLLGRIGHGTAIEGLQRLFDLTEALVDLVGKLVSLGIFGLEPVVFVAQRFAGRAFLLGQIDRGADEFPQSVIMTIGEGHGDLDPFPALGSDGLGLGLELLADETVE